MIQDIASVIATIVATVAGILIPAWVLVQGIKSRLTRIETVLDITDREDAKRDELIATHTDEISKHSVCIGTLGNRVGQIEKQIG